MKALDSCLRTLGGGELRHSIGGVITHNLD
jgi:hypothetical protein